MRLRTLFLFFIYLALTYVGSARAEDFVIGVLNDQSGPYADLTGPGGAEIAQMAIEDFGGSVLGKPIVLVVGDHQNKTDVGVAIARQWYDARKVKAIEPGDKPWRTAAAPPRPVYADRAWMRA